MADHPILFKADMVQAILDGHKTQTRRVIKPQPDPAPFSYQSCGVIDGESVFRSTLGHANNPPSLHYHFPYGVPGDLLWVRETWGLGTGSPGESPNIQYRGAPPWYLPCPKERLDEWGLLWAKHNAKWRPSIFMPKWACRLWLKVKSVRVERVQEITPDDIEDDIAHGMPEVSIRIGRNPAHIHLYHVTLGQKLFLLPGKGIKYLHFYRLLLRLRHKPQFPRPAR